MLSKAPNNNDVTCIAHIMLNKVPNSCDAIHVTINMRLTTMGAIANNSQGGYIAIMQKSQLTRDKKEWHDNKKGLCGWK